MIAFILGTLIGIACTIALGVWHQNRSTPARGTSNRTERLETAVCVSRTYLVKIKERETADDLTRKIAASGLRRISKALSN